MAFIRQLRIVGDSEVDTNNALISQLVSALSGLNVTVPLQDFLFRLENDGSYTYRFRTVDGRIWLQKLTFGTPGDPSMTFSQVTDEWKLSEFQPHRAIRDMVITLRNDFHVSLIDKRWQ